MEFHFVKDQQKFVWDTTKASTNEKKHGISFESACMVFFDPFFMIEDAGTDSEVREAAIGHSEDLKVVYVVHVTRADDAIRIISAREATPKERRKYEDNA